MAALTDIAGIGTIPRMVLAAADAYAERSVIEEAEFALRYDELADALLQSTRACMAAGVERGDRVSIWAPNVHEWILAALGLQAAGAVLVPLNTRFKGAEAAYILNKSGARLLFTVGDFLDSNYVEAIRDEEIPGLERIVSLRGGGDGAQPWDAYLADGEAIDEGAAQCEVLCQADKRFVDRAFAVRMEVAGGVSTNLH